MNPRRSIVGFGCIVVLAAGLSPAHAAPVSAPAGSLGLGEPLATRLPDDFIPDAVSARTPADAWVVGNPQVGSDDQQATLEHWNGHHWSPTAVPTMSTSFVDDVLALSSSDVWAVGRFPDSRHDVLHWDGRAWQPARSAGRGGMVALSGDSPADVWAVGESATHRAVAQHYDGHS